MFVAIMAFFAKISDPAVGGTYMTMLNTLTNLGGNWPSTLALWIIDQLTWKRCEFSSNIKNISETNVCDGTEQTTGKLSILRLSLNMCLMIFFLNAECESNGGQCIVEMDGYYIESIVCVVFGFLYLILWGWNVVKTLQNADEKQWRVVQTNKSR